jgi:hypothetical protein
MRFNEPLSCAAMHLPGAATSFSRSSVPCVVLVWSPSEAAVPRDEPDKARVRPRCARGKGCTSTGRCTFTCATHKHTQVVSDMSKGRGRKGSYEWMMFTLRHVAERTIPLPTQ